MRLKIGSPAPAFGFADIKGNKVSFPNLGRKTWLAFFRYAACPMCNLRVSEMMRKRERFAAANLDIIAVVQSPAERILEYMVPGEEIPFTFLPDTEEQLYKLYQLEHSAAGFLNPMNLAPFLKGVARREGGLRPEGTITRLPADFLVDETGVIFDRFYASKIADHIPMARVDAFIAR